MRQLSQLLPQGLGGSQAVDEYMPEVVCLPGRRIAAVAAVGGRR